MNPIKTFEYTLTRVIVNGTIKAEHRLASAPLTPGKLVQIYSQHGSYRVVLDNELNYLGYIGRLPSVHFQVTFGTNRCEWAESRYLIEVDRLPRTYMRDTIVETRMDIEVYTYSIEGYLVDAYVSDMVFKTKLGMTI